MIVAYWVLASLLAVFYLYSGGKKVLQSRDRLRPMMAWVDDLPLWLVRTIGAARGAGRGRAGAAAAARRRTVARARRGRRVRAPAGRGDGAAPVPWRARGTSASTSGCSWRPASLVWLATIWLDLSPAPTT